MRDFRCIVLGAALLALPVEGDAQPAFEVATIKPSRLPVVVPGEPGQVFRTGLQMDASGLFRCSYCSLQMMITAAWNVKTYQVIGPDWIGSETFAVDARMPAGTSTERAMLMLQTLLTTRFQMSMKTDERAFPVYSLVVTSKGSKLKATDAPANSVSGGTYQIIAPAMPMSDLAKRLSSRADRAVIDATGLVGNYEMKLTWSPDGPDGSALDSLFRALREQLGLELKADKANMKVYVVESASKMPIEN